MSDCIVETSGGVMLIRFNRPDRMNAMGGALVQEMNEAFYAGQADDRVRAFVVTGEGRAWCAGADLKQGTVGARDNVAEHRRRYESLDRLGGPGRSVLGIYNCDKPTIAAVNGAAVGGGLGLCTAFDVRIASDRARFSTVLVGRGLSPDWGLSWFLPRLVGPERAKELFYTGRIVDAEEALRCGLVAKVVPHDELLDVALRLARDVARQPPSALTHTRRALHHAAWATLEQQLEYEWANAKAALAGPEFAEGLAAFREGREPDWSRF